MKEDYKNVLEAKRSLKDHITFMETLLKHLNGTDKVLRGRAVWASWCLHRYFHEKLIKDIKDAMESQEHV